MRRLPSSRTRAHAGGLGAAASSGQGAAAGPGLLPAAPHVGLRSPVRRCGWSVGPRARRHAARGLGPCSSEHAARGCVAVLQLVRGLRARHQLCLSPRSSAGQSKSSPPQAHDRQTHTARPLRTHSLSRALRAEPALSAHPLHAKATTHFCARPHGGLEQALRSKSRSAARIAARLGLGAASLLPHKCLSVRHAQARRRTHHGAGRHQQRPATAAAAQRATTPGRQHHGDGG